MLAQSITGSITGLVTDARGAVIPGVTITVTNKGTSMLSSSTSDVSGNYSVLLHPCVDYGMEVSAGLFMLSVRDGIVLQVQQTERVHIQMVVGKVAESVLVAVDAARLVTENATLNK